MQDDDLSEIKIDDQKIIDNKELNIFEALVPVVILMILLAINIFGFGGEMMGGYSNQYILLIGGFVAFIGGLLNKVTPIVMVQEIWEYRYEPETGAITDRRLFADTHDQPGQPDGSTIDAEGYMWNAQWDGWRLVRYSPEGQIDRIVELLRLRLESDARRR